MADPRRYINRDNAFESVVHMLCIHGHHNIHNSIKYAEVIISGAPFVDLATGYFDEYAIEFMYTQDILTFEERELANRARKRYLLPKLPPSWDV